MAENLKPSLTGPNGEPLEFIGKGVPRNDDWYMPTWGEYKPVKATGDWGAGVEREILREVPEAVPAGSVFPDTSMSGPVMLRKIAGEPNCACGHGYFDHYFKISEARRIGCTKCECGQYSAVPASGERPAEITPHCPQCEGMIFAVNGGENKVRCSQFGCGYEGGIAEFFQDKKSSPMVSAASPEFDHLTAQSATPGVSGSAQPLRERAMRWQAHNRAKFLTAEIMEVRFGKSQIVEIPYLDEPAMLAAFAETLSLAPPESPGPRCASWKEWFWKNYDASGAGFFDRKTGKLVSTEDLCKAYAEQLFAVLVTTSTTIRCELCQEAIIYKVADSGDLFFVHDRCRCARPKA